MQIWGVAAALGARQILTPCAAAGPHAGEPTRRRAAAGVRVARGGGGRAVIGREAVSEDGWLDVAKEQGVGVHVLQGGVRHGKDAVAFTCDESEDRIEHRAHRFSVCGIVSL